jgi:hypothetical protein
MTGTLGRKMSFTAFVVTGNKNGLAGKYALVLHSILLSAMRHSGFGWPPGDNVCMM